MRSTVLISILSVWLSELDLCESRRHGWGVSAPACMATPRRGRRKPSTKGVINDVVDKPKEEKRIYSMPALYDLAFGYRNYEDEVDFLIGQYQALHEGKSPVRVLELAAGPARHSIHALQSSKVKAATALDSAPEMVEYGQTIAAEELDVDSLDNFAYVKEDMSSFTLSGEPFDSAWILLGSLQHLTTNAQVIQCFESINKALAPGGTLILELPHPRETFQMVECTRNGWEVPLDDENSEEIGELQIVWGDDNDEFDAIKQVRQFTVAMELKGIENSDPNLQSVSEVIPMRLFTTQEIDALAHIAGFKVASLHGALADDIDVNDEDLAFRLVCVLQKV
jgi:SAM-dependent methyltransferase